MTLEPWHVMAFVAGWVAATAFFLWRRDRRDRKDDL